MTHSTDMSRPQGPRLRDLMRRANGLGDHIPRDIVQVCARVFPAMVFWQSARTKVDGFSIKDSTYFLFEHVYALPLIPSAPAAVLATLAEHVLPVLLVLGLFARVSALGLLIMTAVIQVFVFPGAWVTHGLWAAALLVTLTQGPGRVSLDHLLRIETSRGASGGS
jgi:putative oxidoreductase